MATPLASEWLAIVRKNMPYWRRLPPASQRELHGLIQVFVAEKQFEGCGGFDITDEVRVTVAAHACALLLGRETEFFSKLRSILVYPEPYFAPVSKRHPEGTVTEGYESRSGESWSHGNVVLSWKEVQEAITRRRRGRNIVLHEFAHQLDEEFEAAPGAPLLPADMSYEKWSSVFGREYRRLIRATQRGLPATLDKYGATSPAEFFAVATECFFEDPVPLARSHPELYAQLRLLYRQDPARTSADHTDEAPPPA
jgi:Mlc titration factor MtfA (ptsG expression regulator)